MPALMTLQGPAMGRMGRPVRYRMNPPALSGVGSTIMAHPIALIAGLVLGGYLAHRHRRRRR